MLNAIEISPKVWWVGGIDWNERSFHGYTTEKGITYNAYLIMDEKITLIDTAKATFTDEFIQRISQVVDPSKIDVVITNHVEMDHSGSLPAIHKIAPNATIYASAGAGVNEVRAHFGIEATPVKSGETLNIGERTLTFVTTPMVHWPDNMVTYSDVDKILFSNDAFRSALRLDQALRRRERPVRGLQAGQEVLRQHRVALRHAGAQGARRGEDPRSQTSSARATA